MGRLKRNNDDTPDKSVRNKILASATKTFNLKGYAAATVREIVADAGVTKPVLYYYFNNKEGVYLELMRSIFQDMEDMVQGYCSNCASAKERLLSFCDESFIRFCTNIDPVRVMFSVYYGPHQGAPFFDFDPYHSRFRDAIKGLIEDGMRNGEFRVGSSEDYMGAIMGALNVAMTVELCRPPGVTVGREGLLRILNVIFEGILTK